MHSGLIAQRRIHRRYVDYAAQSEDARTTLRRTGQPQSEVAERLQLAPSA